MASPSGVTPRGRSVVGSPMRVSRSWSRRRERRHTTSKHPLRSTVRKTLALSDRARPSKGCGPAVLIGPSHEQAALHDRQDSADPRSAETSSATLGSSGRKARSADGANGVGDRIRTPGWRRSRRHRPQSERSARTGSRRLARMAGIIVATSVTAATIAPAAMSTRGSAARMA